MNNIDIFIPAKYEALKTTNELLSWLKTGLQKQSVEFENCPNVPHISLYQLKINDVYIDKIKTQIRDICKNYSKFSFLMNNNIEKVGNNIFWRSYEAIENPILQHLLIETVESIKQFKDSSPLEQISSRFSTLTPEQKSLVDEFGVYWGLPHNFDPHITLIYNLSRENVTIEKTPLLEKKVRFIAEEISVGIIGYHGNIERVIYSHPLES